jgi:hypothetical protein
MKLKKRLQAPTLLTLAVNDRMVTLFAAVHLSAVGTKGTRASALHMSAFGGKADMAFCIANVRL